MTDKYEGMTNIELANHIADQYLARSPRATKGYRWEQIKDRALNVINYLRTETCSGCCYFSLNRDYNLCHRPEKLGGNKHGCLTVNGERCVHFSPEKYKSQIEALHENLKQDGDA